MKKGIIGTWFPEELNGMPCHEEMELGKVYFAHNVSRGAIGCALSHLSIIKFAYEQKFNRIWIMEDDIAVRSHPQKIVRYLKELESVVGKGNWDLFFTDSDWTDSSGYKVICYDYYRNRPDFDPKDPSRFTIKKPVSKNLKQIGVRYGTYSYLISRRGMKKILDYFQKHLVHLPIDMDMLYPEDMKVYVTMKDVVIHSAEVASDNAEPLYEGSEKDIHFSTQ